MSESEIHKTIGTDGLIEFGNYLAALDQEQYRDYTFEMPDDEGRLRRCPLDNVLARFQEFLGGKGISFRVCIGYVDYQHGTMGRNDRTFSRRK